MAGWVWKYEWIQISHQRKKNQKKNGTSGSTFKQLKFLQKDLVSQACTDATLTKQTIWTINQCGIPSKFNTTLSKKCFR